MPVRNGRTYEYLSFDNGLDDTTNISSPDIKGTLSVAKNCDIVDDALVKKRNGYDELFSWGSRNIVRGFEYKNVSGSRELLLYGENSTIDGSSGVLASVDDSNNISTLQSSLKDGIKPDILQFRSLAFIFNGQENLVYDGTDVRQNGITAPDTIPTFNAYIDGELNTEGAYLYAYTYYNSVTGAESSPSLPSASITTPSSDSENGIKINIKAGDSNLADTIRVYRTVSGGNTFFLDGTTAISSTTYNSTVSDAGLGDEMELDNSLLPEPGTFAFKEDNRIFVGGFDSNPNRIHHSKIGLNGPMPESYQADDFVDCNIDDGDVIIGGASVNNTPIIVKENSVGKLIRIQTSLGGIETEGFQKYIYQEISDKVTGVSKDTIVVLDNIVVWLGRDDIYATDGINIFRFGKRIRNLLKTIDFSNSYRFSAINKFNSKQIIFSVIESGQSLPTLQLVGHYKNFPKMAFTVYTHGSNTSTHPGLIVGDLFVRTINKNKVYCFGSRNADGKVHQFDVGNSDDGNGIYFDVRLPWEGRPSPAQQKMYHSYFMFAAGSGSSYNITTTFEVNRSTVISKSQSSSLQGTGGKWDAVNWDEFSWAGVEFKPIEFFPHKRAYFGRFGVNNTNANQPVIVQGLTAQIQVLAKQAG